jgi:hypothetical protein
MLLFKLRHLKLTLKSKQVELLKVEFVGFKSKHSRDY